MTLQHHKSTKSFTEIGDKFSNPEVLSNTFNRLLKQFKLGSLKRKLNSCKTKGEKPDKLFSVILLLPYVNIMNINALIHSGMSSFLSSQKDTFYEFLNNPKIDWRVILGDFASQFTSIVQSNSVCTTSPSPTCLIIDDTTLPKTGKKIEFIGKVFDHTHHTYKLGIKLLALGFFDGKSFLPVDFSLHNEAGKDNNRGLRPKDLKKQYSKSRKDGSPGAKRAVEVFMNKLETGISMIKNALDKGFVPDFVLADSWFLNDYFIKEVASLAKGTQKLKLLGLMKSNRNVCLGNKKLLANKLPELKRKLVRKNRMLKCSYLAINLVYNGTPLKAFFIKMNGQETWKMLVTTDLDITFKKAMQTYQLRWGIEVFFKDTKQKLHLGKCQSNDFDAQIAHTTICFMNYLILALNKRFNAYESIGKAYLHVSDILLEETLGERIWNFFVGSMAELLSELGVDWEVFMEKYLESEDLMQKIKSTFIFLMGGNPQLKLV